MLPTWLSFFYALFRSQKVNIKFTISLLHFVMLYCIIVIERGENMKLNYTTRLDDNLIEAIKIRAAQERIQVCTLIENAILAYLKGVGYADKTGKTKADACPLAGKAVYTPPQDYTATVPAMRQTGGTTASS